jgi:hypothetical protein
MSLSPSGFVLLLLMMVNKLAFAESLSGRVTDDGEAMGQAYVSLYESGGDVIVNGAERSGLAFSPKPGSEHSIT